MINSIKLGWFLALRTIMHASRWTTSLIIFVMVLTFLNLVVVSGILVGLIQGSEVAFRDKYIGDVMVAPLEKKDYIIKTNEILSLIDSIDDVKGRAVRYNTQGSIEANYSTRKSDDLANKRGVSIRGISPEDETIVTTLNTNILEGQYLNREDASKYILVGKDILAKYSIVSDVDTTALRDAEPGTKVRITVGSTTAEYIIKGIVSVKAADLSQSVFMIDSEVRKLSGRQVGDANEIAIRLNPGANAPKVRDIIKNNGFSDFAEIKTFEEGTPQFVIQMKQLFGLLGSVFGSIGIVVAAITLFIVIFINAITKRRQIGILKGIGVTPTTIIFSYIIQSMFYALVGSVIGLALTFYVIKPFFVAHPIDFPFSDGILVAEVSTTLIRVGILVAVAMFAGLIPSWMVVRKNTLNAILGR